MFKLEQYLFTNSKITFEINEHNVWISISLKWSIATKISLVVFFPVQHANTEKLVEMLLGKTQEVENFKKYRRLFQNNPREKHIISALEKSKAIIQTRISKRQRELKETLETMSKYDKSRENTKLLKKNAESLLCHWGIYYF